MAQWIWYPGEFEYRTANEVHLKRFIREHRFMPLWKLTPIEPYIIFFKNIVLTKHEDFIVAADGLFDVRINGKSEKGGNNNWPVFKNGIYSLEPGEYRLSVHVCNNKGGIPCCYVEGSVIGSDADWSCLIKGEQPVSAACDGFYDKTLSPNKYCLPLRREDYVKRTEYDGFVLYDFGKEAMGYIALEGGNQKGRVNLYYGESLDEALDFDYCDLIDVIETGLGKTITDITRAFRYVAVKTFDGAEYSGLYLLYEYKPLPKRAQVSFCDKKLQKIWDTSMYTLELCDREFLIDGVKRDRWYWAADANTSSLINWYSFFDEKAVQHTLVALAGKGQLYQHLSTIPGFTMYWLISFYETYQYTGNIEYLKKWSKRFFNIMDFMLSRCDEKYRVKIVKGDWNFFDWGKNLDTSADSFSILQILLYRSLAAASEVARHEGLNEKSGYYLKIAETVYEDIQNNFYNKSAGAFDFGIKDEKCTGVILRQPNILAAFYGAADEAQKRSIIKNVLQNPDIPKLETPFMQFFELSVLCDGGLFDNVLQTIKQYWGDMLNLGATTFWETYNPGESGKEHYAMYGRKYGKSLCHAWSSSPLYVIGKYFFGLSPLKPGYEEYLLKPNTKLLGDFNAVLPLKNGNICIEQKGNALSVFSTETEGVLEINDTRETVPANLRVTVYL